MCLSDAVDRNCLPREVPKSLYVVGVEALGWPPAQAEAQVRRIGRTVREVLARVEAEGITPETAARHLVARHLAQAQPATPDAQVTAGEQ